MNPNFKAVNTMQKGDWTIVELRAREGHVTPAMCELMRTHSDATRVVPGANPRKVFVLTSVSSHARKGSARQRFVNDLNNLAAAV